MFFDRLDSLNAVTNNAYPVNPADLAATAKFMWQTLFLYIFPPLLMGVTFCGYASELGMYLDEKKPAGTGSSENSAQGENLTENQ